MDFAHLIPLAVGAAISPTMLAAELLILSAPAHGRARAFSFSLGIALVFIFIGILGLTTFTAVSETTHKHSETGAIVDTVAGALLLFFGIRSLVMIIRRVPAKPAKERKPDPRPELGRYFAFGILIMLTNFSSIILYIPALKEIVRSQAGTLSQMLVMLGFSVVAMTLVIVPQVICVIWPEKSTSILARMNASITKHSRTIATLVFFLFGIYLLSKGLGEL